MKEELRERPKRRRNNSILTSALKKSQILIPGICSPSYFVLARTAPAVFSPVQTMHTWFTIAHNIKIKIIIIKIPFGRRRFRELERVLPTILK